jgi:hypothetical protein
MPPVWDEELLQRILDYSTSLAMFPAVLPLLRTYTAYSKLTRTFPPSSENATAAGYRVCVAYFRALRVCSTRPRSMYADRAPGIQTGFWSEQNIATSHC